MSGQGRLTPDAREAKAAKIRASWTPERRQRQAEVARRNIAAETPEQRARRTARSHAHWTPEQRAWHGEITRRIQAARKVDEPTAAMREAFVEDWTGPDEQAFPADLERFGRIADQLAAASRRPETDSARSRRVLALARLDHAWRSWVKAHPDAAEHDLQARWWKAYGPRVCWRRPERVMPLGVSGPARPTMPRPSVPVARRSGEPPRS
jgi:hypothetical protein